MNEQYNLLAEFGRVDGQAVYLARERATGQVAIARRPSDDPSAPLTISHVLDATVPADGAVCSYCMDDLRTWGQFCPNCGREVFGAQAKSADGPSQERLLDAVRGAAEGRFDVLGSIPRAEGGDTVYFAVDLNTADVVALLLNREGIEADGTLAYSLELVLTLSPVSAAPLVAAAPPPPPPPVPSRHLPPSATPPPQKRRTTTPIPEPTVPIIAAPPPPAPPPPRAAVPVRRPLPKAAVFGAIAVILVIGVVFVVLALRPKSEPAPVAVAPDTTPTPTPVVDTAKPPPAPDTTTIAAAPPPAPTPPPPAVQKPAPAPARRKTHINPRDTIGLAEAIRDCSSSALAGEWTTAAPVCQRAAAAGDPDAELSLGMMYQRGNGVPASTTDAFKWFRMAADQGNIRATNYLAWAYANGDGVKRDGAAAIKLFKKSADAGNAQGEYGLGMMYANGSGAMRSDSLAVLWFRKAASQEPLARAELTRRGLTQ